MKKWIGVDLDGTLAEHDGWVSEQHIGKPVRSIVNLVEEFMRLGYEVKVFTARVALQDTDLVAGIRLKDRTVSRIQQWLVDEARLPPLEVTCVKDFGMVLLLDDRCAYVHPNSGLIDSNPLLGKILLQQA